MMMNIHKLIGYSAASTPMQQPMQKPVRYFEPWPLYDTDILLQKQGDRFEKRAGSLGAK